MIIWWLQLIFMLVIIVMASQIFTNALEHFGHRKGISAGATGSIFAAVATALPETMVPLLAIFAGTPDRTINAEIGTGAILGAPLMLSTLTIFVMAISVFRQRGILGYLTPEKTGFVRDIHFFLMAFAIAAAAMFVPREPMYWRNGISLLLIGLYILYVAITFKASKNLVDSGHGVVPDEPMYFTKLGLKDNAFTLGAQILFGLALLVVGAKGLIYGIEYVASMLHVSVLVLSLLVIPIATELPEKINSVLWVRNGKDTLGFGNVTGAMVFQGSILPAIGISLTPWQPGREVGTGMVIALIAAVWLRLIIAKRGIRLFALFVNGGLYLLYLGLTLF